MAHPAPPPPLVCFESTDNVHRDLDLVILSTLLSDIYPSLRLLLPDIRCVCVRARSPWCHLYMFQSTHLLTPGPCILFSNL